MGIMVINLHMETTHGTSGTTTRRAAVGGLAVVGFVALILIGIATAIYAASFIPKALSRLGSANVYLSTLGEGNENGLEVADPQNPNDYGAAPTSVPLSPATTTAPAPTQPTTYTPPARTPTYTQPTYTVVPTTPSYYGLPDLVTTIDSVGYLRRSGDTNSYVADDRVPSGYQGAVRFTVANRGTDVSDSWTFSARLPSDSDSTYRSGTQRALKPGDRIVFTLGFDSSDDGRETIRIEADQNDRINESNESNNEDTASIYLNGSSSRNSDRDYDSNGRYCQYGTYYSNGRYYCENNSNTSNRDYDSNGNYCRYGTYYSNGRYYCESSSSSSNQYYDSNGRYCTYGTYYSNGRYYCESAYGRDRDDDEYDSNGRYCQYGTYYSNGRYYCN